MAQGLHTAHHHLIDFDGGPRAGFQLIQYVDNRRNIFPKELSLEAVRSSCQVKLTVCADVVERWPT